MPGIGIGAQTTFRTSGAGGTISVLDDVGDVNLTSIADNQALIWDSATSKWVNETLSGGGTVEILPNSIVNADINTNAAIAKSKLALTGAILNADLAGSIADSKLLQITDKAKLPATILYNDIDNDLGVHFLEQTLLGASAANPGTDDEVRLYPKRIDANNVGYYIKMEKAGAIAEVQVA